jgi:hypothetical protein
MRIMSACVTYYFYLSYNVLVGFPEKGMGFALVRVKGINTLHDPICKLTYGRKKCYQDLEK